MKPSEIVLISGKGGTGKTTITASFAILAGNAVIADCDVDAADLHLLLSPTPIETHEFKSGHEAVIRQEDCTGCGRCEQLCRFDAIEVHNNPTSTVTYSVDSVACDGCGVCVRFCPAQAIDFPERTCGEWMKSETRIGPMVHARLGIASENSGKLVSIVRAEARRIAIDRQLKLVLIDGPPGVGCPVIASITGTSLAVIITEPTVSGEHDLERVLGLVNHFGIPSMVSINKWDLNPDISERIEGKAVRLGARVAPRIRYDSTVTQAQIDGKTPVEIESVAGKEIAKLWEYVSSGGL